MKIQWVMGWILVFGFAGAQAQTSTLRIACSGPAAGAAVSIDGKYKAECPFDATVKAGTVRIRATKQIGGREAVFDERVQVGGGVVKRIEVQFGGAEAVALPQLPAVDPKEVAMRRYLVEKQEWDRNMAACRPRYDEHLLKRGRDYRRLNEECVAITKRVVDADRETCHCNPSTFDICTQMNKAQEESQETDSYWRDRWCEKQFTKPVAPQ